MPMYMPHKGAMYNPILMNIANNPNGSPSKKQIMSNFAFNDFELLENFFHQSPMVQFNLFK
jgi:hypothetical protein